MKFSQTGTDFRRTLHNFLKGLCLDYLVSFGYLYMFCQRVCLPNLLIETLRFTVAVYCKLHFEAWAFYIQEVANTCFASIDFLKVPSRYFYFSSIIFFVVRDVRDPIRPF